MQAPNAFQFYPPTAAGPPSLTQWVPEPRPVEELQSKFNHNLDYAAGGYSPPPSSLPPSAQYQQLGPPSQQQQQQQQGYAPPPQMQGMKGYGLTSPMRPGPTSTPPYAQAPLPPPNEALPYDVQQFYPQTDQNPRGLPPPTQPNIGYPHQQPAWQDSQYKLSPYPTAAGPFPPSALQEPKGKPNLWQSSPSKANPPLPSSGPDLLSEADARRAREMADDQAAMESTCGPLYNHPNLPYSILSLTVNKSDPLRVSPHLCCSHFMLFTLIAHTFRSILITTLTSLQNMTLCSFLTRMMRIFSAPSSDCTSWTLPQASTSAARGVRP